MVNKKTTPKASFSKISFFSLLCLTLITSLGLGWQTWNSYKNAKTLQEQNHSIQELIGTIMHLDEVLTMSACMGTETGNPKWEKRYLKFEPQLSAAISEAKRLVPEAFILKAAIQTDSANTKLVAMEKHVFKLVRQGQKEDASTILLSKEYQRQKQIYAQGMTQVKTSIQDHITDVLNEYRRHDFFTIVTILTVLPVLFFAFIYIILLTRHRHIIDRTLSENNLEKYRILFDNISDLAYICDTEGNVLFLNKVFKKFSGHKPDEFIGKSFAPLFDGENLEKAIDLYSRTLNGESPQQEIYFKDTGILCEYNNMPLRDERGIITGVIGIARNITERKRLEVEIKEINKSLEERVTERTKEIAKANEELQIKITERKRMDEILQFTKFAVDNNSDATYWIKSDGMITYVNHAACQILGYTYEELVSMTVPDIDPDVSPLAWPTRWQETKEAGSLTFESHHKTKDGCIFPVEISVNYLMYNNKEHICAYVRNISERKRVEEILRESEAKYSRLAENLHDNYIFYSHDTNGMFTYISPSVINILGYSPDEFLTHYSEHMTDNPNNKEVIKHTELSTSGIKQPPYEVELYHKDGSIKTIKVQEVPVFDNNHNVIAVEGIAEDITKRKHTEEKFVTYQTQLKRLSSELSLTEERERRHIAEGLHDRIGQTMTVVKMKLEELQISLIDDTDRVSILNEAEELLDKTIKDLRTLTFEISPPVLYELGFGLALEWLVERFKGRHNISIDFVSNGLDIKLNDDISFFLFKAIRELLFNIVKHAKADRIKVLALNKNNRIRINIEDDGVGFNTSKTRFSVNELNCFGLFSIRERMEYFGGQFDVKSSPGQGACVTLTMPLKQQE